MPRAEYARHEVARREARRGLHAAILADIRARLEASSEYVDPYPIAETVIDWELEEIEEMRQIILGPMANDEDAGEPPVAPMIAIAGAEEAFRSKYEKPFIGRYARP